MNFMDYFWAFVVGGAFCGLAQIILDKTKITAARILVFYVVAGVVLSAVGLFQPLKELAGAGATIPLIGFGHALAEGVKSAVDEKGLLGALTGGLTATSAGIAAAMVFGTLSAVFFNSKQK